MTLVAINIRVATFLSREKKYQMRTIGKIFLAFFLGLLLLIGGMDGFLYLIRFHPTPRQLIASRELSETKKMKVQFAWEGIYIEVLAPRDVPLEEAKEIYRTLLPGEEEKKNWVYLNFYRCQPNRMVVWWMCDFQYQLVLSSGHFQQEFKADHY